MRLCFIISALLLYSISTLGFVQDTSQYYINSKSEKCKAKDAVLIRREVNDGILHFIKDYYIQSGTLQMEGAYSDTNRQIAEGFFYWYHPNRHLSQKGRYVHGKKVGIWKSYSENDVIIDSSYYLNGMPYMSSHRWSEDGKLVFKGEYDKDGKGTGYETEYYLDGAMASFGKYADGHQKDSVWTFFYVNQKPASKLIFEKGKVLKMDCYDENGNILNSCDSFNLTLVKSNLGKLASNNLHYPDDARESGAEGIVLIHCIINDDGTITGVKAYGWSPTVTQSCINEAVNAITSIPKIEPVRVYNRPITYETFIPLSFRLE